MKLHEVPRNTWIRIMETPRTPPASIPLKRYQEIFFDHLDGMYSYCLNLKGQLVHLAGWTEVEILKEQNEKPK